MNTRFGFFFLAAASCSLAPYPSAHAAGDPAAGQEKFRACAACHGAGATSGEAVPKLGGQHAEYLGYALEQYARGERKHAGMQGIAAGLTAQDKKDIAAYVARFELTQFRIPDTSERSALERKLENCRSCHGAQGNNFTPHVPRLIGQDERYLRKALRDYQNGSRKNPSMVFAVKNLAEPELAEMAAYYASQKEGLTPLGAP
jgi:cytochrome c553